MLFSIFFLYLLLDVHHSRILICSTLFPFCYPHSVLLPCQNIYFSVYAACEHVFITHQEWLAYLNCSSFPSPPSLCLLPSPFVTEETDKKNREGEKRRKYCQEQAKRKKENRRPGQKRKEDSREGGREQQRREGLEKQPEKDRKERRQVISWSYCLFCYFL